MKIVTRSRAELLLGRPEVPNEHRGFQGSGTPRDTDGPTHYLPHAAPSSDKRERAHCSLPSAGQSRHTAPAQLVGEISYTHPPMDHGPHQRLAATSSLSL